MSRHDELERMLREGRISRREFIALSSALAAGAALSAMPGGAALAAAAKRGGHFRMGLGHGSTTDSTDPATFTDLYMQTVGSGALYNYLTEVDANVKLQPELAESWDASADASTWTFKLRKGVEFHNGKTLDAGDVIASVQHHLGEDSKSAAKAILKAIVEMKADGNDTVVFKLKEGNADFPYLMSDYHVAILPAKDGKVDTSGVGTGGYMLESFEPGVRTRLKRNPNYWKSGRAWFDSAEVTVITDVAARTNALTTGEIDAMDRVDLKTVNLLKRDKSIRIEETSGNAHYTFAMLTDVSPFDNNHVRLALKFGLDRKALLKTILRGHGYLGNDHPIGRANPYFAKDIPQRHYDPDKARFHLKKAGLSSLKVDLSAADAAFTGAVDAAVLYKEHAAKAGIEINVIREPNDGYWSNVWMKKPWSAVYWGGRPTEDWMFSTAYAAGAPWNDSHWNNERFNKLLKLARAELDSAKRREMYREMQLIVRDQGGVVVPVFNNYVFATSRKVGHGKMGGNWSMDGFRAIERWWFV